MTDGTPFPSVIMRKRGFFIWAGMRFSADLCLHMAYQKTYPVYSECDDPCRRRIDTDHGYGLFRSSCVTFYCGQSGDTGGVKEAKDHE